jgi:hypothetical protein
MDPLHSAIEDIDDSLPSTIFNRLKDRLVRTDKRVFLSRVFYAARIAEGASVEECVALHQNLVGYCSEDEANIAAGQARLVSGILLAAPGFCVHVAEAESSRLFSFLNALRRHVDGPGPVVDRVTVLALDEDVNCPVTAPNMAAAAGPWTLVPGLTQNVLPAGPWRWILPPAFHPSGDSSLAEMSPNDLAVKMYASLLEYCYTGFEIKAAVPNAAGQFPPPYIAGQSVAKARAELLPRLEALQRVLAAADNVPASERQGAAGGAAGSGEAAAGGALAPEPGQDELWSLQTYLDVLYGPEDGDGWPQLVLDADVAWPAPDVPLALIEELHRAEGGTETPVLMLPPTAR